MQPSSIQPVPGRFRTREVRIGNLWLGGSHPIRIQSMVNTSPSDPEGTVRQIIALAEAGCEMVRLTVPTLKDVQYLEQIRAMVRAAGIELPLVADVHFSADIALACAPVVEKVRINPGNYRKPGQPIRTHWSHEGYAEELEEIGALLAELASVCRIHGTAIRIGSNHGSLSPRIMDRYGDTPEGMTEAALEFVRIFHSLGFHDLVLSMKSSNVRVMTGAYRLLVKKMEAEGFDYPLHLGVTEAGYGDEGIVKSAAGIGLLLEEGIGDTIRVSITGDPVEEIPAAITLARRFGMIHRARLAGYLTPATTPWQRRETNPVAGMGGTHPPLVFADKHCSTDPSPDLVAEFTAGSASPMIFKGNEYQLPLTEYFGEETNVPENHQPAALLLPLHPDEFLPEFLRLNPSFIPVVRAPLSMHASVSLQWLPFLDRYLPKQPVILKIECGDLPEAEVTIHAAVIASCWFNDGLADALWLSGQQDTARLVSLSFMILQATRSRITATEYISCPSCGRTRFNIREVAEKIRERTAHLTGLKIGIMGCIVNGPGEMADADYGYVGSGTGKVTLYKGKTVMQRGIAEEDAIESLIRLIKDGDDWLEP